MADTSNLTNFLGDIADAIRTKKETTEQIPAANFDTEIASIETGVDTSDATATSSDIVEGKTAYGPDGKIEGTVKEYTMGTTLPAELAFINNSPTGDGLTFVFRNDGDNLLRPFSSIDGNANNTIIAEKGEITPEKIVKGNTIYGVEGVAESGTDTSDSTAIADDIISPKTAYTKDGKIMGTIQTETVSQEVSLYNNPITLINKTLSNTRLYDNVLVDNILTLLVYSDNSLTIILYNIENNEVINEVSYVVSDNFSFSTVQDLTISVVERNVEYIDYVIGIGYNSNNSYLNFRKLKYTFETKNFELYNNINYTISDLSYNQCFRIEKAINYPNRFYVLQSHARANWDVPNYLVTFELNWSDTSGSIARYNNGFIGNKDQRSDGIFELTGNGNWLRTSTGLAKLNENPSNVSVNNGINNVYFSHNMNYMLQGTNFYKITGYESYSEINNSKELITTTSSCTDAFFSKDDKYLIMLNGTTITIYSISDDGLLAKQNFLANTIEEIFNTFGFLTYNSSSHDIQFISAKEGELFIEKLTRNGIDYHYIYNEKCPNENEVLHGIPFYSTSGIKYGTMKNNGELIYNPLENEELIIPVGYTSGGKVNKVDITTLNNYKTCEVIADNILGDTKLYSELEYIESTGTQYLDTGVVFDIANCRCEVEFQYTSNASNQFFCGTDMTLEGGIYQGSFYTSSGFTYSQTSNLLARTIATGVNTGTNNKNIYLFARNWPGEMCLSSVRIYSAKFYKNNTLIRDFIPVKDNIDGKVGLYDKVEDTFYSNSGTGVFVAGGVI